MRVVGTLLLGPRQVCHERGPKINFSYFHCKPNNAQNKATNFTNLLNEKRGHKQNQPWTQGFRFSSAHPNVETFVKNN